MKKRNLETLVQEKSSYLFHQSKKQKNNLFNKDWWYGKILAQTMKSDKFKTSIFHFIDVLPSLETPEHILSHLNEYFKGQDIGILSSGLGNLAPSLMANTIKKQVNEMAKIFITGSNSQEALKAIKKMRDKSFNFSMDLLGEATLSEQEGKHYQEQYLKLMDDLIQARNQWEKKETFDTDLSGDIPSINISIKATSLEPYIKEEAWEFSKEKLKNKLRPLFEKAVKDFVFLNLDMEQYNYKNLLNEVFQELLLEPQLKNYPHFGIVVQAYLKDSLEDLKNLIHFSKKRNQPITIRLVKGAYWDSEVLIAKQKNWPLPVYTIKEDTDANFERCLEFIFENHEFIKIAVGSHNIRSLAKSLALHQIYPKAILEFQFLYGMGESLAEILTKEGYKTRLYSTIGELIPGMSYLVRRLLENTANQSFIRSSMNEQESEKKLLASPQFSTNLKKSDQTNTASFQNTPLLDFTIKKNRDEFQKHLEQWKTKLPLSTPIIINGKEIKSPETLTQTNPSQKDQIINHVSLANKEQAEQAIQLTSSFFQQWKQIEAKEKCKYLKKLALLIKEKEFELAALQVFEVGKTWSEAHGDVCEAIDFCNYYANSFLKLSVSTKTAEISGEDSFSHYEPIGITAAIAPWNFPLAILAGMVVAPLVCGNPVIIKPAEQSSAIAYEFAKLLLKSGFPKESFAFLPGKGENVGDYLVSHPQVPIISFTGSFEVGSQIIKKTSSISNEQKHIKKNIVEMGGKNAIIVDLSADLDEAIIGILHSAFGFQGQKCSACSRLIIVEDIYDKFIERFIPAMKSLIIDHSEKPHTFLGAVIDEQSYTRIKKFLQTQSSQSEKIYESETPDGGWFIPATLFMAKDINDPLLQEELFAPILTLFKVKTFEEAIQKANTTRYGLTAGLYSRQPSHIEMFKKDIEAGNIYINRNCTGALVQRHPFGGYKMSGLGSKTGGPEYLKQFLHNKITTENTMRRGFAPEIFDEDFLKKN